MQATINARAATKTASIEALRASLPPTATPVPSNTPTPEPTATPSPTATSSPSSTPQPTETPIPSPTPYLATVTRDANLRQGPGTTYASVGIALGGDVVALVARSANGEWLLVSVDGADVWIGRFLVDVDDIGSLPVEAAPAR